MLAEGKRAFTSANTALVIKLFFLFFIKKRFACTSLLITQGIWF